VPIYALSISEAARELNIARESLEGMIINGSGPKCRTIGSRNFILRQDWEVWLENLPLTNLVDIPADIRHYQKKLERREDAAIAKAEEARGPGQEG
jgi:hypothetical protein